MPPHRTPNPNEADTDRIESHDCSNERRLRYLEQENREMNARLHEGDLIIQELRLTVKALRESVDKLTLIVEALNAQVKTPNSFGQQVLSALITWGVPAAVVGIIWVLVNSGAVAIGKGHQ